VNARIVALFAKELLEIRRYPGIFLPALLTGATAIALPFVIAIGVPIMTGEPLASSPQDPFVRELWMAHPELQSLGPEGTMQSWMFRQFLLLLVMSPIAAAMSVAAWAIVGEKQARSLEPLLASPVTTFELLAAKTLSALLPAVGLSVTMFGVYVGGIAALAGGRVAFSMLTAQPLAVMFLLGPLAALAALQLAVCLSSRASDPRSAQQMGALVILPLAGLMVLQLMGAVPLTLSTVLSIAAGLMAVNMALAAIAVAVFDRESILTRWK
jgi:ABC-2 type transport system permease protein